jgi:hypothetical protein
MQKQWKDTTEHLCVNNKIGTGSGKEPKMVPVPVILFAVKANDGGVGYYYSPACKNYKFNKATNHYRCETAIGEGDSPCQLQELLNEALRREGLLYNPHDGMDKNSTS